MVPDAEGSGGDKSEPERASDDGAAKHFLEGTNGLEADEYERNPSGEERDAGGINRRHCRLDPLEEEEGKRAAGGGAQHEDCPKQGIARSGTGGIDRNGDAGSSDDEAEPLHRTWPRALLNEWAQEHPPKTAGGNEQGGQACAGSCDRLVEENILDERLGEGESEEEFPGGHSKFCGDIFAKEQKSKS